MTGNGSGFIPKEIELNGPDWTIEGSVLAAIVSSLGGEVCVPFPERWLGRKVGMRLIPEDGDNLSIRVVVTEE